MCAVYVEHTVDKFCTFIRLSAVPDYALKAGR